MKFTFEGKVISIAGHKTLLDAILEHDTINFQCRDGFCGSCALVVKSGSAVAVKDSIAFTKANEILACCTLPAADGLAVERRK